MKNKKALNLLLAANAVMVLRSQELGSLAVEK